MRYTSSHAIRWGQNSSSCPSTPPSPSGVPEQLQAARAIIHADSFQSDIAPPLHLPRGRGILIVRPKTGPHHR